MKKISKRLAGCVCTLTFIIALFGGIYVYSAYSPIAFVVLDSGGAMELTLNTYGRVITNRVYHPKEAHALTALSLQGMSLEGAVCEIVDAAYLGGHIDTAGKIAMLVSVQAKDDSEGLKISRHVLNVINKKLKALNIHAYASDALLQKSLLAAGHNANISPGRLHMISIFTQSSGDPISSVYKSMAKVDGRTIMRKYGESIT